MRNEALVDRLAYVGFIVNNYLLIGTPAEHIAAAKELFGYPRMRDVEWTEELTPEEEQVEWAELCIKGPNAGVPIDKEHPPFALQREMPWDIEFDAYTPVKLQPARVGRNAEGGSAC